jgi:hypothetical protein
MIDRERSRMSLIVGAFTLFAAILRWGVAMRGGFWRDEALFLSIVRLPSWREMLDFLRYHESHPPLFYAIMRVWLRVAGDSDAAAIALVVGLSALIVPVSYWLASRLYSRRAGVMTAGLTAISPALVDQASVRPYAFLSLLVLLSSYQLICALHRGDGKAWGWYVLFTTLMLYTHNWTWLVGLGQFITVMMVVSRDPKGRARDALKAALAGCLVLVLYSPWMPTLLFQTANSGHAGIVVKHASLAAGLVGVFVLVGLQSTILSPLSPDLVWTFVIAGGALLVTVLVGFRATSTRLDLSPPGPDPRLSAIATRVILVTALSAFTAAVAFTTRTLLVLPWCIAMLAAGILMIAAARGIDVWDRSRADGLRQSSAVVAGLATMVCLIYAATLSEFFRRERSNAREIAAHIAAQADSADLVIIAPGWLASSFNHYFHRSNPQIDYPTLSREPIVRFTAMTPRMAAAETLREAMRIIEDTHRRGHRVWLISDAFDIVPMSESKEKRLIAQPGRMGNVRTSQIQRRLDCLYGNPILIIGPRAREARSEELVALLYATATAVEGKRPP